MGIARGAYRLLLDEKKKGVLIGDTVLQLGRQCILFDHKTLLKYSKKHQVPLSPIEPQPSFHPTFRRQGYIDDITLFKSLGFKNVHSLDYSDFEGADITWDLNQPIPKKYWGQFDIIYDGGTTEHVFNFPQVLTNIYHLLKVGGKIIHVSPSHNHVDHGFYMYSPQVYFEYYKANGYDILTSQIAEHTPKYSGIWRLYHYEPGLLDSLSYGGFGKKMILIHLVAQKKENSTFHLCPQQGGYVRAWKGPSQEKKKSVKVDPITRLGISLRKKIKRRLPRVEAFLQKKKLSKNQFFDQY
jgi:hypothetical protein